MKKIGICTDCLCDLPEDYLASNGIEVMHFYIHTATGRFRDGEEITSDNILEYLESGEVIIKSNVPEPEEYKVFYEDILTRYETVIYISTSDKIGLSYPNAAAALKMMGEDGKRVILINSGCLSTGLGHMVLHVAAMRDEGRSPEEIVAECEAMRNRISCTFIVPDADYLYRMEKVGRGVKILSKALRIHPVLCVRKGRLSVKSFRAGSYEKSVIKYVRSEFRHSDRIDRRQLFITHAGSPAKIINQIKAEAASLCPFDTVTVTKASAAISSNCGPQTVGVLFVYK